MTERAGDRHPHFFREVLKQRIGGFLDVLEIPGWSFASLRRFKFLPGKTGRTQARAIRRQQRRMRHETGNLSIRLLLSASTGAALGAAPASFAQVPARGSAEEKKALQAVGDDYEAYMLEFLYSKMRDGVDFAGEGNPFAPSGGEKIFRAMRDEAVMKDVAKRRPLGFGTLITEHLQGRGGIPQRPPVEMRKPSKTAAGTNPVATASLTPGG